MTTASWILLGILIPAWLYLAVVLTEPLWRRPRKRLPEMRTPLGKLRVGLDSPDLMERYPR